MTHSGSDDSRSRHATLAERGRLEAETGMAHLSGYADPDVYRAELNRTSNTTSQSIANGHATGTGPGRGYVRAEEDDYHGQHGREGGGVGRGTSVHGTDDGYGRPGGVRGFEQQCQPIDQNPQMGPVNDDKGGLSLNRNPQNVGSEAG